MTDQHSSTLYDKRFAGKYYSPFTLHADPMKRLLLINFTGDSDDIYMGFEPQYFDDPLNGKGLLVIGWRKDGLVDVYHQPGLNLKRTKYDIVAKGLGEMVECPFEGAHFEITERGVDLQVAFDDLAGRPVSLRIHERSEKARRPFSLLAPFPSDTERPPALPIPLLYDFYFVRRANTEFKVEIAGRTHKPDLLPLPIDGAWMTFSRYSPDPLILTWNEDHDAPMKPIEASAPGTYLYQGVEYDLVNHTGHLALSEMRPAGTRHTARFIFDPPFPNTAALPDGARVDGAFTIQMDPSMGQVNGQYRVERRGEQVDMSVHPSGGWQPGVRNRSVRLIFFLARIFKNWPKTYYWVASIDLARADGLWMKSGWQRSAKK